MQKLIFIMKLAIAILIGLVAFQQYQIDSMMGELHRLEIYVTAE